VHFNRQSRNLPFALEVSFPGGFRLTFQGLAVCLLGAVIVIVIV